MAPPKLTNSDKDLLRGNTNTTGRQLESKNRIISDQKVYLKSESSNIELGRLDKLLTLWSLSNVLLTFRIF